jgi:nucleoside-diphosphate-sugar epimerase
VVLAEARERVRLKKILVTGGSGFFGSILKNRLLSEGWSVVNLDLVADPDHHEQLTSIRGDIRDPARVDQLFAAERFDAVMHCAAMLAHEKIDDKDLWTSNVDGTRILAEAARRHGIKSFVFTSTNCLWAHNAGRPVREDDPPAPVELYGRSKLAAEQVLKEFQDSLAVIVIRCPTIIDEGRLGLLAILFEFIDEGRKVWVVGDGSNRYQFIYAQDLATACVLAMDYGKSGLFHVGADNVPTLREVYQAVIDAAGTGARIAQLPRRPTIAAMKLAHTLGVSPLGPYHYRMIAEDFVFDTTRIRDELGWRPTVTNQQMMLKAYQYYAARRKEIDARAGEVSAHSRPAAMGVIRLLKWLS